LLRLCIEKRSIAPAVISGTMLLIWCSATAEWGRQSSFTGPFYLGHAA